MTLENQRLYISPLIQPATVQGLYTVAEVASLRDPKILGVTHPKFTFKNHADNLKTKVTSRTNILKALAGSLWGKDKETHGIKCSRKISPFLLCPHLDPRPQRHQLEWDPEQLSQSCTWMCQEVWRWPPAGWSKIHLWRLSEITARCFHSSASLPPLSPTTLTTQDYEHNYWDLNAGIITFRILLKIQKETLVSLHGLSVVI